LRETHRTSILSGAETGFNLNPLRWFTFPFLWLRARRSRIGLRPEKISEDVVQVARHGHVAEARADEKTRAAVSRRNQIHADCVNLSAYPALIYENQSLIAHTAPTTCAA
jgi:hypothetical protein